MSNLPAHRVLVIQTAFLGDIVLVSSFLANLRRLLPQAEIRLLTTPIGAKVIEPNSFGVKAIAYDKRGKDKGFGGFVRVAKRLREFQPDLVFCLHRSLRSVLLARLAGGATWTFHDAAGSVLLDHRVHRPKNLYEAEKNHKLLEAWAGHEKLGSASLFPRLEATSAENAEAEVLLEGVGKFVAFAPSSVWATKRWPAERFAKLANLFWEKHGLRAVLVGGKEEADFIAARELLASFRGKGPAPLDLIGKTTIGTMKAVLARARLVVANDTAPLHVAIAMGAPVLGVFGPTTKELGFFPLAPSGKAGVAELAGLECRPCGLHGHKVCPLGHFRCMLELDSEAVFNEAEKVLCQ